MVTTIAGWFATNIVQVESGTAIAETKCAYWQTHPGFEGAYHGVVVSSFVLRSGAHLGVGVIRGRLGTNQEGKNTRWAHPFCMTHGVCAKAQKSSGVCDLFG